MDRRALYEALVRLPKGELEQVLFRAGVATAGLRDNTHAERVIDVVAMAEADPRLKERLLLALTVGLAVAVVGLREEVGAAMDGVVALLRGRKQVGVVRELAPVDAEEAIECPLRIVLLGAGIEGGAAAVGRLLDEPGTLAARRYPIPDEDLDGWAEDFPAVRRLTHRVSLTFAKDNAAEALRTAIGAALDRLVPPKPGAHGVVTAWEEEYLRKALPGWLQGSHAALLDVARKAPLERARLYVSLEADRNLFRREYEDVPLGGGGGGVWRRERYRPIPRRLDRALSGPDFRIALVVGEAGSGKTVLLQHVAAALALQHVTVPGLEDAAASVRGQSDLDFVALAADAPLVPIPILVEARELATDRGDRETAVERLLARRTGAPERSDLSAGLRLGRYILLVDSLDEVPTRAGRKKVLDLLAGWTDRGRIVLTSRPGAHTQVDVPAAFVALPIGPLTDELRRRMAERWVAAQAYDGERATSLTSTVAALRGRFPPRGADRPIEDNPLLLTCIFVLFHELHRLPDNTADLYKRMVEILCGTRAARADETNLDADPDEVRRQSGAVRQQQARAIAAAMQAEGGTAVKRARVAARLRNDASLGVRSLDEAATLIERIVSTTAIFREEELDGDVVLRPWHRSFQEYLAAAALAAENRTVEDVVGGLVREGRLVAPEWRGCLAFLVGAMGQVSPGKAQDTARALLASLGKGARLDGRLYALASGAAAEYRPECFDGQEVLVERIGREGLAAFARSGVGWGWRDRVEFLDAVARLGVDDRWPDPRRDSGGWVVLESLGILNRPVMVADYAGFVTAGGYEDVRWWIAEHPGRPDDWISQLRTPGRPVVGVNFVEASAFCRWATEHWVLPGLGVVDLPTSDEWEAIVRSEGGGEYPWGDEDPEVGDRARASYGWGEGSPDSPTPIGAFPHGDVRRAGRGVHDLVGNVWGWTRTNHESNSDAASTTLDLMGEPHMVLGGAWGDSRTELRVRGGRTVRPSLRVDYLGLRVVFRPQPVSGIDP